MIRTENSSLLGRREGEELGSGLRNRGARRRLLTPASIIAIVLVLANGGLARGAGELAKNGLFTQGSNGMPDGWTHEAYVADPAATHYAWNVDAVGIGTVGITSQQPNDARWIQSVPVSPGTWYRISGWIRTENVGPATIGAYLSAMGTFNNSAELRGTQDWQPVQLWVKTGSLETSLVIGCRLGGYGSLNTGSTSFAGISVEAAGTPPANEPFVYGGAPQPAARQSNPLLWMQGVALLVAIGIALLLWRYLTPPSASIPP